jgi:hypothetical protein
MGGVDAVPTASCHAAATVMNALSTGRIGLDNTDLREARLRIFRDFAKPLFCLIEVK